MASCRTLEGGRPVWPPSLEKTTSLSQAFRCKVQELGEGLFFQHISSAHCHVGPWRHQDPSHVRRP